MDIIGVRIIMSLRAFGVGVGFLKSGTLAIIAVRWHIRIMAWPHPWRICWAVCFGNVTKSSCCLNLRALVHLKVCRLANERRNNLISTVLLEPTQLVEDPLQEVTLGSNVLGSRRVVVDVFGCKIDNAEVGHNLGRILAHVLTRMHEGGFGAGSSFHRMKGHVANCT